MPPTERDHPDSDPPKNPKRLQATEVRIAEVHEIETLNIYSLVLSAAGITHRIMISGNRMDIYVSAELREHALEEIAAYAEENAMFPRPHPTEDFTPAFRAMAPLLIGGIVLMYGVTGGWQQDSYWFVKGAGDSRAILHDLQLYRLITPLTLHADIVHLLGNCVLGVFLLHYFFHLTGNGIGLALLLLTAATANFINVLVHGPGHLFVGFSTAVFCVIGMLCTMNYAGKPSRPSALHLLMPIMAGLALLALLGSSGARTDLGAHLFGLLVGLLAGNVVRLPYFAVLRSSLVLQIVLGAASLLTIAGCWYLALV